MAVGAAVEPEVFAASFMGAAGAFALILVTAFLTFRERGDATTEYAVVMLLEAFKLAAAAAILIAGFSLLSPQASRAFGISFGALYILSYLVMLGGLLPNAHGKNRASREGNGV